MSTAPTARPADALRDGDRPAEAQPSGAVRAVGGVAGWVDDRTGAAKPVGYLMKKVFPDHWSFMLGEIAMYSMIVCLLTGAFLTFWFIPSAGHTVYDGSYVPLRGVSMSEAYASTLNISFDIKGGLIIRQIHHWAALMFIVALTVHMFRVFFTGAFRKPREINWVIGSVMALLAIIEGFAGYSLPDDLLSGTGLRAMAGFVQTAPVIGSYLVYGIFGGPFPGEMIIPRLYSVHILLIPAILVGAVHGAHRARVPAEAHPVPRPGPHERERRRLPGDAGLRRQGRWLLLHRLRRHRAHLGARADQPDLGLRSLRPLPGDRRLPARLVHGLRRRRAATAARLARVHVLRATRCRSTSRSAPWCCCRSSTRCSASTRSSRRGSPVTSASTTCSTVPRNNPVRTGIGMAGITAYSVFMFAAGNDIMAIKLGMSINDITWFFRIGLFVLPPLMFWVTKRICLSLQRRDRDTVLHGRETGTIIRQPDGRFFERHDTDGRRPTGGSSSSTRRSRRSSSRRRSTRTASRARRVASSAPGPPCRGSTSPTRSTRSPRPSSPRAHHVGPDHEAIEPSASGGARPIEAAESEAETAGRH